MTNSALQPRTGRAERMANALWLALLVASLGLGLALIASTLVFAEQLRQSLSAGRLASFDSTVRLIGAAMLAAGIALALGRRRARSWLAAALRSLWAHRRVIVANAIFFGAMWGVYLALGSALARPGVLRLQDVMYGADNARVIADLTSPASAHLRTTVHPTFVLFFNPIGSSLMRLARGLIGFAPEAFAWMSAFDGPSVFASVLMTSAVAALTVVLARLFFLAVGFARASALLWALVFGFAGRMAFAGALPETYTFSILFITLTFLLIVSKPENVWRTVAAGVLVMGTTISNVAQYAIAIFFNQPWDDKRKLARNTVGAVGAVFVLVTGLNFAQKALFPSTEVTFQALTFDEETDWLVHYRSPQDFGLRVADFANHVVLLNVVAPRPCVMPFGPYFDSATLRPYLQDHCVNADDALVARLRPEAPSQKYVNTTLTSPLAPFPPGALGSVLWLGLVALGVVEFVRKPSVRTRLLVSLMVCVLFNFTLYMIGYMDFFLHSANWTFQTTAWVAIATAGFAGARWFRLWLGILAVVLLLNSVMLITTLGGLFG